MISRPRRPGRAGAPRAAARVPRQRTPHYPDVPRRGAVYGLLIAPVDQQGRRIPGAAPRVDYIGQTRQLVKTREGQHREDRPFGDLIVGVVVIEDGMWDNARLNAREQWYIRRGFALSPDQPARRPVYNYDHNVGNPHRVPIPVQVEHRKSRQPGWEPPVRTDTRRAVVVSGAGWWAGVRRAVTEAAWWWRTLHPRARRTVRWGALWAVLAVAVGVWVGKATGLGAGDSAAVGAVAATGAVVGLLRARRKRRRRPRGRGRRR